MKDCHINIFYGDEDGGYIADILDLEARSAFVATGSISVAADGVFVDSRKAAR